MTTRATALIRSRSPWKTGTATRSRTRPFRSSRTRCLGKEEKTVDENGEVEFERENGEYSYTVAVDGNESDEYTVEVDGDTRQVVTYEMTDGQRRFVRARFATRFHCFSELTVPSGSPSTPARCRRDSGPALVLAAPILSTSFGNRGSNAPRSLEWLLIRHPITCRDHRSPCTLDIDGRKQCSGGGNEHPSLHQEFPVTDRILKVHETDPRDRSSENGANEGGRSAIVTSTLGSEHVEHRSSRCGRSWLPPFEPRHSECP